MWCDFPLAMNNCWWNLRSWTWLWHRRYQYCNRLNMSFLVKLSYRTASNANKPPKSSNMWKNPFHGNKLGEKAEVLSSSSTEGNLFSVSTKCKYLYTPSLSPPISKFYYAVKLNFWALPGILIDCAQSSTKTKKFHGKNLSFYRGIIFIEG